MEKIKRALLPILVIVVIVAALVFRLSSCSVTPKTNTVLDPNENAAEPTPTLASAAEDAPSTVPSPTPPYTDDEIQVIYSSSGFSIVEIRDAGDLTMVHYYQPSGVPNEIVSRLDWFDRATGARELAYGWAYTDKFEIKADKTLNVLTTGLSYVDGGLSFPQLFHSEYADIDGARYYSASTGKYYAPLEKSCTVGIDRYESLTDINFNTAYVSLGFDVQVGYESAFYAASTSIPKMTVINEAGVSTITLYKTILSPDFKKPAVTENSFCSLVSVARVGLDTIITLSLKPDAVTRYNISTVNAPSSNLPYAIIEYTKSYNDYPSGW